MSKSTTLKTSTSNSKTVGAKHRDPSKERTSTRKVNMTLTENNILSGLTDKSKPAVKLKESASTSVTQLKKSSKDSNKPETKIKTKPENHKYNAIKASKSSPTVNKISLTDSKSKSSLTKSKRLTAPDTPPSNRVTKTQYFPSKNMYSNAVQGHLKKSSSVEVGNSKNKVATASTDKSKTKLLNHHDPKTVKSKKETAVKMPEKSKLHSTVNNLERPRTATLRKGSIVNSNIAGPDIPKSETPSLTSLDLSYEQESQQEEEDTYEDDFDSYESDFEEYQSSSSSESSSLNEDNLLEGEITSTSDDSSSATAPPTLNILPGTDDERMLDSGNFDMPENKHKQLLDNIKESNEHEGFTTQLMETRSNMASLSDEGFEEGKSSLQTGNLQFINFAEAQKKWKHNKNVEKRRKRGEEILSMIRLDQYNFILFDMAPVTYDVFIRSYGKTNTVQISTQTGDDNVSEEIQTDYTETSNKWTQFPVTFSKIDSTNPNYLEIYKQEFVGVGVDTFVAQDNQKQDLINHKHLEKFLSFASETVSIILNESLCSRTEQIQTNSRELPFSKGYIKFDVNSCTFLKNRPILFVTYCSLTNIKILTVHGKIKKVSEHTEDCYSTSIICIWGISKSEEPEQVLSTTGELNCCCFISDFKNIVIGGLCDGALTIWDLHDYNPLQKEIFTNHTPEKRNHFQEPNYTTEIESGHSCKVVAIQQILSATDDVFHNNIGQKSSNNQICSLDELGVLIIWGIITRDFSFHYSTLPWNRLSLVQNSKMSLKELNSDLRDLSCTDMSINLSDPHHIFVSTNYGCIIHYLPTGTKAVPKKYNPVTPSQANCLEPCPFSPLYFFAGYEDGAIVLYSRLLEKPLIAMSNKENGQQHNGIELLQWSFNRPCIFYAKDSSNTLHIWDLKISDLYPIYSIPFKDNITCMKLSPSFMNNSDTSYMVLATENGSVHLHLLHPDYGPSNANHYQQDVKKFLNYVNRL